MHLALTCLCRRHVTNLTTSLQMPLTSVFTFDRVRDELKCGSEVLKLAEQMMSLFNLSLPHFPVLESKRVRIIYSGNTKPFQLNFVRREHL